MSNIEKYDVHTEKGLHAVVEISQDVDHGDFVGQIDWYEIIPAKATGQNLGRSSTPIPVTLRDKDKGKLIEKCKLEITKAGDSIEYFERLSN